MTDRTPLLHPVSTQGSEYDESEIVSYVQERRTSMASMGDKNPFSLVHTRTGHRGPSENIVGGGSTSISGGTGGLSTFKSHSSFNKQSLADVSDILSHHANELADEPETSLINEVKSLVLYSVPLSITFLLQYSLTVASVFSVGRLGLTELAAVSLSSMTANISGYAIIQGVSTCLDTLCAQSYGRKDYNMVGLHFVRCSYLLFLLYIPMFILWVFLSKPILLAIVGEDQLELCTFASDYLKVLSFGLPGFILFENAKHFLQCQGVFHASTYVLFFCAPLNALLNYLLVWDKHIGMGFIGAPLSVVITDWVMCFMLFAYIYFVRGYECWPADSLFSKRCFTNWQKMIDLSVPGVLMVEAEWLAFEIITFTASTFGTEVLAAQSIISTTCVLCYQIPFAISIAASTRVAWYIGAASKNAAKIASNAAIYTSMVVGVINGLFLFIFREQLAKLFTSDELVITLASKVLIIGACYQVNDCISCATNGVLRGQGRQKIGGYLNLFSYYCIALPLAFLFAFYFDLELVGLWLGMIIALFTVSVLQYYFVLISDWDHIINECINEGIEDGGINIDAHSLVPSMSHGSLLV